MNASLCPVKSICRLPVDLAKAGSMMSRVDRVSILRPGEVMVMRKPETIRVVKGTVWITETPAAGDLLLHGGGRLVANQRLPWVVEALDTVEIIVE